MSQKQYAIARNQVRWNIVDGRAVLIHTETLYYYSLNRTGTVIWSGLLEQPMTESEITNAVANHFGQTPGQVSADVNAFLEQMIAEGLIEFAPA